jgi:hypothetical protein
MRIERYAAIPEMPARKMLMAMMKTTKKGVLVVS